MAKKSGDGTVQKLRRILEHHKTLRRKQIGVVVSAQYLADKCSDAGLACDERTVRDDLRVMKEYLEAPLPDRANGHTGYFYKDDTYSLFAGLDNSYLSQLNEVVALVRQMASEEEFSGLEDILIRLEERNEMGYAEKNQLIQFEQTELKGKEYLVSLYQHISRGEYLMIAYQPYGEAKASRWVYPVMLREYNNRWYLIAWEEHKPTPQNFALDRMLSVSKSGNEFAFPKNFDFTAYYRDLIGVTRPEKGEVHTISLKLTDQKRAKYLETKKLHPSQRTVDGIIFELDVIPNLELESKILEFGPDMEVLAPDFLREQVREKVRRMGKVYGTTGY